MTQLPLQLEPAAPRRKRAAALRHFHVQGQPLRVAEALEREQRAKGQDLSILQWMRSHPGRHTPSQVAAAFPQWPVTSVRRALTNLANAELLRHDARDRRPGPLGAPESVWEAV